MWTGSSLWANDSFQDIFADPTGSLVSDVPNDGLNSQTGAWTNLKGITIIRSSNNLLITSDFQNWTKVLGATEGFNVAKLSHVCWSDYWGRWFWKGSDGTDNAQTRIMSSQDGINWDLEYVGKPGGFNHGDNANIAVDPNGVLAYTNYTFSTPRNPVFSSSDRGQTWSSTGEVFNTTGLSTRVDRQFDEALQLVGNDLLVAVPGVDASSELWVKRRTAGQDWPIGSWSLESNINTPAPFSLGYDPDNDTWCFASGTSVQYSTDNLTTLQNASGTWSGMSGALYTNTIPA